MTDAIENLLDDDGVFVFEVSYLMDIIDNFLFDTVYHEHLSYHAIEPFQKFFKLHGLHLFDVKRIHTKGGSIRGFVQKASGKRQEQPIINAMIQEEQRRGLGKPDIFNEYENAILMKKKAVQEFVNKALSENKKIACYGASTTVITLMYHFELKIKLNI
jgi:tetrahydromethanopterin S-methyltransferase subunit A